MLRIEKTNEFERWFRHLKDRVALLSIGARLRAIEEHGELCGDWKPVGDGVVELRFDTGPGYRVYALPKGGLLLLLLLGGDKSSQKRDIRKARVLAARWEDGYAA